MKNHILPCSIMGYLKNTALLGCILSLFWAVPSALATKGFIDIFDKPLKSYEQISKADFDARARTYTKEPFADNALAFEIKLPHVWSEAKSFGYSIHEGVFTDIGRYQGPVKFNKASSYIVIKAMQVGLQASAKTMAASIFRTNGYTVQGTNIHSRNHIETLHVEVTEGETYIVRSVFLINGGRLVVMSYYLPQTSWTEEKDLQYRIVESFNLLNEVETEITDIGQYDFWDLASIKFPKKWNIEALGEQSFEHMSVALLHQDGQASWKDSEKITKGRMMLSLVSKGLSKDISEVSAVEIDRLVSQGVVIEREIDDTGDITWPEGFENAAVHAYQVLDSSAPSEQTELWISFAQKLGYNYVVSLITPSRDQDFLLWGENTEAMRFMIEHIDVKENW